MTTLKPRLGDSWITMEMLKKFKNLLFNNTQTGKQTGKKYQGKHKT